MEDLNRALIAKLGWQIQCYPQKFWVKTIRAKYLKTRFIWDTHSKGSDSRFWRGILKVAPLLKEMTCNQIGSGTSIRVWNDPWLPFPTPHARIPRTDAIIIDEELNVDSLMLPFSRAWNSPLIQQLFCSEDAAAILSLPAPRSNQPDKLIWTVTNAGIFSLKSDHQLISAQRTFPPHILIEDDWKRIWRAPLQDRLKLLLWKIS